MRTLIAHEWLSPTGGSENVVEALLTTLPDADLWCLWNDAPHRFPQARETWLARSPARRSKPLALGLSPAAWRSVPLAGVDRVVASSHAMSHQLATRAAHRGIAAHAYVHSPARYLWEPQLDTRGSSAMSRAVAPALRRWDGARVSDRVHYAANSQFVAQRIRTCWGMQSRVIYPPVEVEALQAVDDWRARVCEPDELRSLEALPQTFFLAASRLVGYKRLDHAIKVAEAAATPLVIAGEGPDALRLLELARASSAEVTFLGRVSSAMLHALYQQACLFVFMPVEDFGIMAVEAISLGTPVLVNELGGGAEICELTRGGASVAPEAATAAALRQAVGDALSVDAHAALLLSRQFGRARFEAAIMDWVQ